MSLLFINRLGCGNKNYVMEYAIKEKLDIKTIILYTKIVLKSN